jgi:heme-degrading monooxygenase HmoA
MNIHLAQINIGRMKAPLDDPAMSGFMSRLDDLNALAERSRGFIWRLQGEEGNNTYLRPYEDARIIVNMSVWETIDALRTYVYSSAHAEVLKQRREWFEKFDGVMMALWWVPAGDLPSVDEAKRRLASLEEHGPTPFAFTFKTTFPPILEVVTVGK